MIQRAAIAYVERLGWAAFPTDIKKQPMTPHGHLDATTDANRLTETWPAPDANVGVATGAPSGFWVLDVDPRHGGDASLAALIERETGAVNVDLGTFFATWCVITPSGGMHLWWKLPKGVEVPCSAGDIGPGLDVRGDGGYVVVPPSRLRLM